MNDLSTLTTIAVWTALGLSGLWLLVLVVRYVFFPISKQIQLNDSIKNVIWCSYEVAVDKGGHKYFISTLPDGVQTIPPANPVNIGPGLGPSARAFLTKPEGWEVEVRLPWKRTASELDEGTVIRVRVVR